MQKKAIIFTKQPSGIKHEQRLFVELQPFCDGFCPFGFGSSNKEHWYDIYR